FIAGDHPAGFEWRVNKFADELLDRLKALDSVDAMRDTSTRHGTKQIQYGFLRRCANRMANHWLRTLHPGITSTVMEEIVDPRLLDSLTKLANAEYSDVETRLRWKVQSALDTDKGGLDVGGLLDRAAPAFVASLFSCYRRMKQQCTLHCNLDIARTMTTTWVAFRSEYETLRQRRIEAELKYAALASQEYHSNRGGILNGFHPKGLPPAKAMAPIADIVTPESKFSTPAQRTLTSVNKAARWLRVLDACHAVDKVQGTMATIKHREASRFIAASQEGAGAAFDISPDGSFAARIPSPEFTVIMQRQGGLVISEADGLCYDAYDKYGDKFSNNGEYNRRHNSVLYKTRDAMVAVAIGSIVQGDKAEPEKVSYINEGKTVDIAEIGGDEVTGGDVCVDTKVPSPLTKSGTSSAGRGSVQNGGKPASVGHIFAFGNTEELLRITVLGCRRRGRRRDGPLNHSILGNISVVTT
ncbi:MAG: hypothetical protein VXU42_04795, partial [Verrucomicrobiota bacterium]|nr:hypothetical protein [Verrucomicrobiota bacterium]